MDLIVRAEGWSRRVGFARGFRQRFTGLRRSPPDTALLIPTRSVHGFGMRRAVLAIGLDQHLRVLGVRTLYPNRLLGFRGARYVLEIPVGAEPPPLGSTVEVGFV